MLVPTYLLFMYHIENILVLLMDKTLFNINYDETSINKEEENVNQCFYKQYRNEERFCFYK